MENALCLEGRDFRIEGGGYHDGEGGSFEEGADAARGIFKTDDPLPFLVQFGNSRQIAFRVGLGVGVVMAGDPVGNGAENGVLLAQDVNKCIRRVGHHSFFGISLVESCKEGLNTWHQCCSTLV